MGSATFAIFCFTYFVLMDTTDGNYMTLSSSDATVGQPVTLQCAYVGNYTPSGINFYFDQNLNALLIRISPCIYLAATGYNTTLYDKTCGVKEVNLTIKSVTEADIGTTWHCDAYFTVPPPTNPTKTSTKITKANSFSNKKDITDLSRENITAIAAGSSVGAEYVVVRASTLGLLLTSKISVDFILVFTFTQGLSKNIRILLLVITFITPVVLEVILFYHLYKHCSSKGQDGMKNQANGTTNTVKPEPSDMEKGPPNKLAPIVVEMENSGEAKKKKKKQKKKNGEITLEKGSYVKDNNFLNEK